MLLANVMRMPTLTPRELLLTCLEAALDASDPQQAVAGHLDGLSFEGRIVVFAVGKAAPAMTRGVAQALEKQELEGIVVTNRHDAVPEGVELRVSAHPIPDATSAAAGEAMLTLAAGLTADDRAIVLISGGGSALAEAPIQGVSLADITETTRLLLRSGAHIGQINTVRRRLSLFKGGGLLRALSPAAVETLAVSDVVGDDPATIASGPTVLHQDPPDAAARVIGALGLAGRLPAAVVAALHRDPETAPDPVLRARFRIIAGAGEAARAAADTAAATGWPSRVVDTALTGEASTMARAALEAVEPGVTVYTGETTVTVRGSGTGGRNHEAALAAALAIEDADDLHFLAAGTDGIDGTTQAAGAIVDGTTIRRSRAAGFDPITVLENNDSGTLFEALGDQIVTGHTGTNVGDLWIVLRTGPTGNG